MKKNTWMLILGIFLIISGVVALFEDFVAALLTLAVGAALIFLWKKKKFIVNTSAESPLPQSEPEPPQKRQLIKEQIHVAGVGYYQSNLKKLACKNPDWSKNKTTLKAEDRLREKIYRYTFINKPVKLIPEPENKHDPNAIMITVAGEKVGYVDADNTDHIRDILNNHEVKYISAFVHGGEYKVVAENDVMKINENIHVSVTIAYV